MIDNFHFVHNVVFAGGGDASRGLQLPDIGNAANIDVSNNIFLGFNYQPVYSNLGEDRTIDSLSVRNNIFFDNGVNAQVFDGSTPTTTVVTGNIANSPEFVSAGSDFHLRAGSWGVDDGVSIDWITEDFEGVPVGDPLNIGSYETIDE